MSKHTPPPRPPKQKRTPTLPRGGTSKLVAMQVAVSVADAVFELRYPRGTGHLRDQLVRAADAVPSRLTEANAHTMGNRRVHLESAYAECQETKELLFRVRRRGVKVPDELLRKADRLGALLWGLLRAERKGQT